MSVLTMVPRLRPVVFLLLLLSMGQVVAVAAKPPNFVVIFCDDLGYADIGPFGSDQHRTPHIDKMAAEGMRLTNFYSTCCVCTPSRSSLMTGCYPKRIGMHENERGQWVLFPGNSRGLNPAEHTIAEELQSKGYATAIVGKWHLGDQPEFLPTRQGFDSYFGIPFSNDMGKTDRDRTQRPATPLLRNEQVIEMEPDQRYLTRRYTEEALSFIESHKERPFFLYLPHSMPHWPQYASQRFAGKSANKAWGDSVEEIDWSTGQILDRLKTLGLDDNTVVIFTSDNGGAKQHGASNGPLRGGKGSTWEGGQRVCCVARWPGKIPAQSQCDALTTTMDLFPTFSKLADGTFAPKNPIDGRDIADTLMGRSDESPHDRFLYYFRGELNAVRQDNWKLFVKRREKTLAEPELYNLAIDIAETKNVATDHPDVVRRLKALLDAARIDLGDGKLHPGTNLRPPGSVAQATTLTKNVQQGVTFADVFTAGQDGYHTYRIPSLLTTPRGTLLAICEARKTGSGDHGNLDLVMKRSDDLGSTWSEMKLVYEEGGDKPVTIGNPCPVVDQETGRIWMPFCRNNQDVLVTYSDDDGHTWSPPRNITSAVKKQDWGWYATGPGVGIQMTRGKYNGRLVIPCDHREQREGKWIKRSHTFHSDDHGETWVLGGTVADHTDECQVVELHDGQLMINMRNYWSADGGEAAKGGQRAVAISDDGGESWGELTFDPTLVEPICQASFMKLANDTFRAAPLLFANPASQQRRAQLQVRVSRDQGKTWPIGRVLHQGPAAYSCLTTLPDRSIGCLYEAGEAGPYETLRFARFPMSWIERSASP